MLYGLRGILEKKGENFFVLKTGDFSFKLFTNNETLRKLIKSSEQIKCFTYLYVRDENLELYGFLEEEALKLFEMLNTVTGIGPKTALGVLDVDKVENIMAAIIQKRPELLMRTSGIGNKTAERIILELHSKIKLAKSEEITGVMDLNREVEEALVGLGYGRHDVRRVLGGLDQNIQKLEDRIREALKSLGRKP